MHLRATLVDPEIAAVSALAKNVQQENLRIRTAAVEIWYDPNPTSRHVHQIVLRNPGRRCRVKTRLILDRAKMIRRELSMQYVAGRIAESFKTLRHLESHTGVQRAVKIVVDGLMHPNRFGIEF
jgi:hypothetical protein